MAKKRSKTPTFTAVARVVMIVECEIEAGSMAEAYEVAKGLGVREWVEPNEDCTEYDSSVLVTSISGDKHFDTEQ